MKNGRENFDDGVIVRPVHLQPVLITGGSGFIGTNLADRLLSAGETVMLLDNLSRPGVERNYEWLQRKHGKLVQLEIGDIRNAELLNDPFGQASAVFHFAAQVAVTSSLINPRLDFEVNAMGTLNVLEALRSLPSQVPLIFTSTNKVYGSLKDVTLLEGNDRYEPKDESLKFNGIGENRGLAFYSPYGCSKGTADQYVLDYARLFGLPAAGLPNELCLRAASARHGRPRLGGPFSAASDWRTPNHNFWRRKTGKRYLVRRGFSRCIAAGARTHQGPHRRSF